MQNRTLNFLHDIKNKGQNDNNVQFSIEKYLI